MNAFYKIYCRTFQTVFKLSSALLPWPKPTIIEGGGSIAKIADVIEKKGLKRPIIITSPSPIKYGFIAPLTQALEKKKLGFSVYSSVVPNPTVTNVDEAVAIYKADNCDCIVAVGGGSPIDCAKGVAVKLIRPKKTLSQMRGVLKVLRPMPTFFAVPTTAGSGSEATIAAVISDPDKKDKYAISDPFLTPHYAVLDPKLTVNLPKSLTATTGMDALTHAVEAFIGRSNTKNTKKYALEATKLIFENLKTACETPTDLAARENMQRAATLAGMAFTRAYVGYVHALAHAIGGYYNVAHGLANAVILPYILKAYGNSAFKKLAELGEAIGLTGSIQQKAEGFIESVVSLNQTLGIPSKLSEQHPLEQSATEYIVKHALKEANPLYPVPKILDYDQLAAVYAKL